MSFLIISRMGATHPTKIVWWPKNYARHKQPVQTTVFTSKDWDAWSCPYMEMSLVLYLLNFFDIFTLLLISFFFPSISYLSFNFFQFICLLISPSSSVCHGLSGGGHLIQWSWRVWRIPHSFNSLMTRFSLATTICGGSPILPIVTCSLLHCCKTYTWHFMCFT